MSAIRTFISYRNRDLSRFAGDLLYERLTAEGFEVFYDQERLKNDGGVEWEARLEKAVKEAEVLIVLVQAETGESTWVKREIETMREAKGAIVPIIVTDDETSVTDTLETLGLAQLQYLPYDRNNLGALYETIRQRSKEVREVRRLRSSWQHGRSTKFTFEDDPCEIWLVNHDATRVAGFDVLVNTENTFMQMARFFESSTLSATIRRKGAEFDADIMYEDTVQDQLNYQVRYGTRIGGVPVRPGQVLITQAGHKDSILAQRFRYLFHAATVMVDRYERRINPISAMAFPEIVAHPHFVWS